LPTIAEKVRDLQRRFADRGIDSPRLDAELLIGHALDIDRTHLLARLQDPLPESIEIEPLAARRLAGEPIAYIVGHKEFLGLSFRVTPAVLIPRPETELLVEWALEWLRNRPYARVIDVGTGSGAIAAGVALGTPHTISITAIDNSDGALAIARFNADRLAPGRIDVRKDDLLARYQDRADLVLANLPYLRPDQIDGNFDLVAEPRLALDGGSDGLALIERLVSQLPTHLTAGGAVAVEIDPSQSSRVSALFANSLPDAAVAVHQDLAGLDRFVTAVRL
jgi:release factor glutamine methyltransferase